VAVLAISGAEPASLYLRAATALGAAASLPKPFTVEQLLTVVGELLATDRASLAQSCRLARTATDVPCSAVRSLTFAQPPMPG